jgi:hypothetical protein
MTTTHYEPLAGYNPMRARARFYIWDTEKLEDGPYDVMAMERVLNGEPAELNEAEKYETARRLYGLLRDEGDVARRNKIVADRVGTSDRTILRWHKDGWPPRKFNDDGSRVDAKPAVDTIEERFASKTQTTDDGHLNWTGGVDAGGFPRFSYQRRSYLAARLAYQQHTGTEPAGIVRPACGNALCVKGDHLEDRPSRALDSLRGHRTVAS